MREQLSFDLKKISFITVLLSLMTPLNCLAELDINNPLDARVINALQPKEKNILLNKQANPDAYSNLGKKYREDCLNNGDGLACYLVAGMTKDPQRSEEFLLKGCNYGEWTEPCEKIHQKLCKQNCTTIPYSTEIMGGLCRAGYFSYCDPYFSQMIDPISVMMSGRDDLNNINSLVNYKDDINKLIAFFNEKEVSDEQIINIKQALEDVKFLEETFKPQNYHVTIYFPTYTYYFEYGEKDKLKLISYFLNVYFKNYKEAIDELASGCEIEAQKKLREREWRTDSDIHKLCNLHLKVIASVDREIWKQLDNKKNSTNLIKQCFSSGNGKICEITRDFLSDKKIKDDFITKVCQMDKYIFPDCGNVVDLDGF